MSTLTTVATVAQPAVTAAFAGVVAMSARMLGAAKVARAADDVGRVAVVVRDAEKIPAVEHAVEDVERAARAEAEKVNAATHGAIDALAAELAKTVPNALQAAIVAAHAAVPPVPDVVPPAAGSGPETAAQPAEMPAAQRVDTVAG